MREVIGRRLDRLSASCNEVLTIASVVGREFSLRLLQKVMDQPQERLLESLEEALPAKIIDELPGLNGTYQFSHALIQQTLAAELSTTRKVLLHARIAQSLEDIYGTEAEAHAAELAYHLGEAEAVSGSDKLVAYSQLSGERALATYAYEEAMTHFQRAVAAKEGHSPAGGDVSGKTAARPAMDVETADLLFGLGRAQSATYQVDEAVVSLSRAFDYYASDGRGEQAVALACHPFRNRGSLTPFMTEIRRRALDLVPSDSLDAGRLFAVYGLSLGTMGEYDAAKQAFHRAIATAQRKQSTELELRTLANAAQVDAFHLRWHDCLNNSLEAISLSGSLEDVTSLLRARLWAGNALLQFGKPEEAELHAKSTLTLAQNLRDPIWLIRAFPLAHMVSHLTGDFQEARELSDSALAAGPKDPMVLAWRVRLEYELGDSSSRDYYLDRLLEVLKPFHLGHTETGSPPIIIPLVAQIGGNVDVIVEKGAQAALTVPFTPPDRIHWARIGLALMAVQQGDAASAAEQYRHLAPSKDLMTVAGSVTIARVLGNLAYTTNQPQLAESHFEDGLVFCRNAGYRPELAWTYHDYATLLRKTHQRARALALVGEALPIASELGMNTLLKRLNTLRDTMELRPVRVPGYSSALTDRQVEVLGLIAKGKTNREIASELSLSERTVERHIADIYAKVGARNRAEATAFAMSQTAPVEEPLSR